MYLRISLAAKSLGLCTKTLRRYDREKKLSPAYRTPGGHRRHYTATLKAFKEGKDGNPPKIEQRPKTEVPERVVGYIRVSAAKQRADLERQRKMIQTYVQAKGWELDAIYQDIASGLNDQRAGLRRLITSCLSGHIDRVIISYADRLARFGTNLLAWLFQSQGVRLECLAPVNLGQGPEQQLLEDFLALMTSFTGKFHRMRRAKGTSIRQPG